MQAVLLSLLEDRLYERGKTRNDIAAHTDRVGHDKGNLSRLVNGKSNYSRAGIDAVVDSYANALDADPIDLWSDALERWREIRDDDVRWIAWWRELHARRILRRQEEATPRTSKQRTP